MKGMKKKWKSIMALLLSIVLALSAPVSYLPTGMEVYAAQADENGFVIVDGVLKEYIGTATEIEIPEGVTSIGNWVFSGCSSITSIRIPESVTSIGDYVFLGCSGLTSIEVEEGNRSYDSRENCNAIIESSNDTLIKGCRNTVIPEDVSSIGDYAFSGCSGLMSITIPERVSSIGEGAFVGCSSLTSISIPDSVGSIREGVFEGCSSITSIRIPEGVSRIGHSAFSGCSSLTSIRIPEGVNSIGERVFSGCSGLTSIVVETGNTVYNSKENCNAIIETARNELIEGCSETVIPSGVTSIGYDAFSGRSGLKSISIPDSVSSINGAAFSGCSGLTSMSIPEGVSSIGNGAFSGCSGLKSIVVEEGNTVYDSRENCNAIIEIGSNTLIAGCSKTVIPSSVTSIGNSAFSGCSGLKSIVIPESVKSIGEWVFSGCSGITSISIPSSVTSIGDSAFSGCSSLTNISIPSSVMSIAPGAFWDCDKLTIYGDEGSYAQIYAEGSNIPFCLISEWNEPEIGDNILTLEEMTQLIGENKTQDTVIETSDGLTFTFKKGAMELVEGLASYDFGVEITGDYASLPNQIFTEDEFAFWIDYNYEGQLPGEAQITIPAGSKWAEKRLYYYEIKEDGTYSYICRSMVAKDGSYTVKQSHCSSYVATTKAPEKLGNCDGVDGVTSSDALAVLRYEVGITQTNFDARFADCDGQDGITSSDALAILRYEVGVIDKLY